MSKVLERIKGLGLILPVPSAPQGAYVPAIRSGSQVYVSGQLPIEKGKLVCRGKVGAEVDVVEATKAARLCMLNALGALSFLGIDLEAIDRVLKLTGHISCSENFYEQAQVLNGASELCLDLFAEKGQHTRVALGAWCLPLNATVELEVIFSLKEGF